MCLNLGDGILTQSDPTDDALATIASILDHQETPHEAEKPVPLAPPPVPFSDGENYSRIGPGPIAALRFKWTARRADNGEYFVDETLGENSTPMVTGPMSRDEAVRLVDEREYDARRRFEQLRHEMTGRAAAADLVRKGDGEA